MALSSAFDISNEELRDLFGSSDEEEEFLGFEEHEIPIRNRIEDSSSSESEDEASDSESDEFWQDCVDGFDHRGSLPSFTATPGFKTEVPEFAEPLEYFQLFVGDDLLSHIVEETNRYADQHIANSADPSPSSRVTRWKPVNVDELKVFIALIFSMGLVQKISIQDYWSQDEVLLTPFQTKLMKRDYFLLLLKFLHFNDNRHFVPRGSPGYDPLFKIRPVYDMIINSFYDAYQPKQHLSLDESTIGWRGNLHYRVYNPTKSNKFHIKAYVVTEATSGYVVQYQLYTGKSEHSDKGATYDVVWSLMHKFFNLGYKVYMDNYYSGVELFQDLLAQGTMAAGTIRRSRKGLPKERLATKLGKGESLAMYKGDLLVHMWRDKRDVCMLSTFHLPTMLDSGKVNRVTGAPVVKPSTVLDYNMHMGGVDRSDQLMQYFAFTRKTLKAYKKVFFHLLHLCEVQAYILYKKNTDRPMLHRKFCAQLIKGLITSVDISNVSVPGKRGRTSLDAENISRLTGRHFPIPIPPNEGAKRINPTRKCKVCHKAGVRKETRYMCSDCNCTPLCVHPCFEKYHCLKFY